VQVEHHAFSTSELRQIRSASRSTRFTPRKSPGTHWIGSWVGARLVWTLCRHKSLAPEGGFVPRAQRRALSFAISNKADQILHDEMTEHAARTEEIKYAPIIHRKQRKQSPDRSWLRWYETGSSRNKYRQCGYGFIWLKRRKSVNGSYEHLRISLHSGKFLHHQNFSASQEDFFSLQLITDHGQSNPVI
jgi:hypothetical protein